VATSRADTMPAMAKAGGNYLSSQPYQLEARRLGFDEGIGLDYHGCVSEGSAENIFIIKDSVLITPPFTASVLPGINAQYGDDHRARPGSRSPRAEHPARVSVHRRRVFFTGSAAEISPVAEIDGIKVGEGRRGPITKKLQQAFFDIVQGKTADKYTGSPTCARRRARKPELRFRLVGRVPACGGRTRHFVAGRRPRLPLRLRGRPGDLPPTSKEYHSR